MRMFFRWGRFSRLAFVPVLCLLIPACSGGGPITKTNYEKINKGMSQKDVEAILGQGQETAAVDMPKIPSLPGMTPIPAAAPMSAKWIKWGDDKKFILIAFMDDKVVMKQQQGL